MSFLHPTHKVKRDFRFFQVFSWYLPGLRGTVGLVLLLLGGAVVAAVLLGVLTLALRPFFSAESIQVFSNLISYPLMFMPPVIYAMYKSRAAALFDQGYAIDSNHFGRGGAPVSAALAVLSTLGLAVAGEVITSFLPPMPESLKNAMRILTEGPLWVSILLPCIMAPFFEEWLCRGMILRGLLQKMHPAWAISISAFAFALVHMNPWQAVPAFLLGALFGYVYYRTGSLKLTMLMHAANNLMSVILSRIDSLKDVDYIQDALSTGAFISLLVFSGIIVCSAVLYFSRISLTQPKHNCDPVTTE